MSELRDDDLLDQFKKALATCRTCSHVLIAHPKKLGQCMEAKLTNKEDGYKRCGCKLFVPKDNLEFLEWAAERKEHIE